MADATDWNRFYRQRGLISSLTARLGWRDMLRLLDPHLPAEERKKVALLVELGGGNSIFYPAMRSAFPNAHLVFADVCQSDAAFAATLAHDSLAESICADVLDASPAWPLDPRRGQADVVLSFGLIEHFPEADTRRAVTSHFALAKPGGLVFVSFPTPSRRYRFVRTALELASLWLFKDERPLPFAEVRAACAVFGEELACGLSARMGLTQGMLLYRTFMEKA